MSAPLVGVTPIFAVCFWGNDMGKLIAVRLTCCYLCMRLFLLLLLASYSLLLLL